MDYSIFGDVCQEIDEDSKKLLKEPAFSIEELSNHNPLVCLSSRSLTLVKILCVLSDLPLEVNTLPNKELHIISKIIELIYGLRKNRLILPISFTENLNVYTQTRNKGLLAYASKVSPGNSVAYIEPCS